MKMKGDVRAWMKDRGCAMLGKRWHRCDLLLGAIVLPPSSGTVSCGSAILTTQILMDESSSGHRVCVEKHRRQNKTRPHYTRQERIRPEDMEDKGTQDHT